MSLSSPDVVITGVLPSDNTQLPLIGLNTRHPYYDSFAGYPEINLKNGQLYNIMAKIKINDDSYECVDDVLDQYVMDTLLSKIPARETLFFQYLGPMKTMLDSFVANVNGEYKVSNESQLPEMLYGMPYVSRKGFFVNLVLSNHHYYVELILNLDTVVKDKKLQVIFLDSLPGVVPIEKKLTMAKLRALRILETNLIDCPSFDEVDVEYLTIEKYHQNGNQCGFFAVAFVEAIQSAFNSKKITIESSLGEVSGELNNILNSILLPAKKGQKFIQKLKSRMREHGISSGKEIARINDFATPKIPETREKSKTTDIVTQSTTQNNSQWPIIISIAKPPWECLMFELSPFLFAIFEGKIIRLKEVLQIIGIYDKKELGYRNMSTDKEMSATKRMLQAKESPKIIKLDESGEFFCGFHHTGCTTTSKHKSTVEQHMKKFHSPVVFVYFNVVQTHFPVLMSDLSLLDDDEDLTFVIPIHVESIDFPYVCNANSKSHRFRPIVLSAIGNGRKKFIKWLKKDFKTCKDKTLCSEIIRNRGKWITANNENFAKNWSKNLSILSKEEQALIEKEIAKNFPLEFTEKEISAAKNYETSESDSYLKNLLLAYKSLMKLKM